MITICVNCPHGKRWHENGTGRCGFGRNTGGTGRKGRCDCEKFRAGEQVKTPVELARELANRRTLTITVPIGLCVMAAFVQSFAPLWLVVALIVSALPLMCIAVADLQGEWEDANEAIDLLEKWRRQRDRTLPNGQRGGV